MIAYLEGKLRFKSPEYLIIDVHGVGYRIQVPLSTFYQLPKLGEATSLHVHTHVREDALQLYGFRSLAEKEMFIHLITINGVGPKLALNILSSIQAEELKQVVINRDLPRLQKVPGVGKKTAERILLELKNKLKMISQERFEHSLPSLTDDTIYDDALSALTNLGYQISEAQRALKHALSKLRGETVTLEHLIREALRILA